MNKEKLIANWDSLKAETKAQILALADKEIEEEYFVPKMNEVYHTYSFRTNKDTVVCSENRFIDSEFDKINIEIGACFQTPEEAIFYGNCDYYTKRFETYVNRHSDKLDWNRSNQIKYYTIFATCDSKIDFSTDYISKRQGVTYASSEQILKDAIADIGEENFLKYVMKVKE